MTFISYNTPNKGMEMQYLSKPLEFSSQSELSYMTK